MTMKSSRFGLRATPCRRLQGTGGLASGWRGGASGEEREKREGSGLEERRERRYERRGEEWTGRVSEWIAVWSDQTIVKYPFL